MSALHLLPVLLSALAQEKIQEEQYGFTVPAGFQRTESKSKQVVGVWRRPLEPEGSGTLTLQFEILPGRLAMRGWTPEKLRAEAAQQLAAGTTLQVLPQRWRDFELLVLETETEALGGARTVSYSVMVPISPRALQFRIKGPAGQKDLCLEQLRSVLQGVQGKTNWMTPARRALVLALGGGIILGWGLYLLYGIVWVVAYRNNPGRAARVRAVWLGIVSVLLLIGVTTAFVIESENKKRDQSPPILGGLIAFVSANRARKLWKLGRPQAESS